MELLVNRDLPPTEVYTWWKLRFTEWWFHTIERPWVPADDHPGGMNGVSCVPPGRYALVRHDTTLHPETWALVNPELGVWHEPGDIPKGQGGRSSVLIHPANFARELEGCIAPGVARSWSNGYAMVTSSRVAFARIKALVPWTDGHFLTII